MPVHATRKEEGKSHIYKMGDTIIKFNNQEKDVEIISGLNLSFQGNTETKKVPRDMF